MTKAILLLMRWQSEQKEFRSWSLTQSPNDSGCFLRVQEILVSGNILTKKQKKKVLSFEALASANFDELAYLAERAIKEMAQPEPVRA